MDRLYFPEQDQGFYCGQRFSFGGALCTVRYYGPLPGTTGQWLGVEWDDVSRGKHKGIFQDQVFFTCLSSSSTAGSFVRPSRSHDRPRSFLEALRFKYAPHDVNFDPSHARTPQTNAAVQISGKVVEEVGFERIRQQQAILRNLRIVLLDELCLRGVTRDPFNASDVQQAQIALSDVCLNIVELDVGWSLIETWTDVAQICQPLKALRVLRASGTRLRRHDLATAVEIGRPFERINELHIDEHLLKPDTIPMLLISPDGSVDRFPVLHRLFLNQNHLTAFPKSNPRSTQLSSVTELSLERNEFESLVSLPSIVSLFPNLRSISLQGNRIYHIGLSANRSPALTYPGIETLNLSRNLISDYSFVDDLSQLFPNLKSLRISSNPLFASVSDDVPRPGGLPNVKKSYLLPTSAANPQASDTAFSLTLARLPSLLTLNYSAITSRDREDGEIYYISVADRDMAPIADDLKSNALTADDAQRASTIASLKAKYPRYETLCLKYDRPSTFSSLLGSSKQQSNSTSATISSSTAATYPPGTLGARLVKARFYLAVPSPEMASLGAAAAAAAAAAAPPAPPSFIRLLPTTLDVYRVKGLVARTLCLKPLRFRLIYESNELDPLPDDWSQHRGHGDDQWDDWGDWDVDGEGESVPPHAEHAMTGGEIDEDYHEPKGATATSRIIRHKDGTKWTKREVEIVDGTREWGRYLDDDVQLGSAGGGREVRVRVEPFVDIA